MKQTTSRRICRRIAALGLSLALISTAVPFAGAVTQQQIDDMKKQQAEIDSQISSTQSQIEALEQQENSALSQALLYQQQMDLLNGQIVETQTLIADYEVQIADTQVELEAAQAKAAQYYQLFCERVRDMEENEGLSYWSILFNAASFSDLLDRLNFVKDVVNYDNSVVNALEAARKAVADTEAQLEQEKAGHEAALSDLEDQQTQVQAASDKNDALLAEIQANQDAYADQLAELESDRSDLAKDIVTSEAEYQAQLEALRRQAEEEARKRQEEEQKRQEEEERQRQEEENNRNNNSGSTETPSAPSSPSEPEAPSTPSTPSTTPGSTTGAEIVAYASQFLGNPYVWGGTSLTSGCDCSGFTMKVYAHFGISLPHYSGSQRYCGVAVSYADAQPGDLICYTGHVGIYIGNGQIINAIDPAHGIGISKVNTSRDGFCVRRLI